MSRSWMNKIIPALLAGTLTLSFGAAVQADSNKNENNNGKKHEHVKAEKEKENKPVTQLEAVTQVMDLLEEELDLDTDGDSLIGRDIPAWAKDSVELALDYDIVSREELKEFNKPATRMFVTKLLVNALKTDIDDIDEDTLSYRDIAKLSAEEKAYLSFALEEDLIEEYEDDKAFKPNKPVTRSEMESFVDHLFDKIDEDDYFDYDNDFDRIVKGTISHIDDDVLRIGSKSYEVSDDVTVKVDGDSADFKDLETRMKVRVYFEDQEIEKIYAFTTDERDNVEFTIEKESYGNDDMEEAVKRGDKISDTTPNLGNGDLYIVLNGSIKKEIDLEEIDGTQDNGFEVANELESAIEDALDAENRVNVTFDDDRNRFIFETNDSPTNVTPSIQFDGDKDVLDDLGLDDSVDKGSFSHYESLKIIVESDASEDQTYELKIEIDDEDIKETMEFSVDENDTAEEIAKEIADVLEGNAEIGSTFDISVDDEQVTLNPDRRGDLDIEIKITKEY